MTSTGGRFFRSPIWTLESMGLPLGEVISSKGGTMGGGAGRRCADRASFAVWKIARNVEAN